MFSAVCDVQRADELEALWMKMGYKPGAPAHIPPALVAADKRSYRSMKCGHCWHRSQLVKPFHRREEYKLLLCCRKCGAGTEA